MSENDIADQLGKKCDHDRCHCVPDPATAVAEGKSIFCSAGCAAGTGCTHSECECATAK